MPVLGITGGIASGKTAFTAKIAALLSGEIFNADRAVRSLLESDAGIRDRIRAEMGEEVMSRDDVVDRVKLREVIFGDEQKRRKLEAVLHPPIRSLWLTRVAERKAAGDCGWMVIEIPLLYETHAELHMDIVVVIACSSETQLHRILHTRNLSESTALKIMTAQFDQGAKIQKADHVIWNDGGFDHLTAQVELLAGFLKNAHG
ncbi:MAG: dephospho-CoA kinase [Opitutaceae bacterium]|nr:dephospho-CoA kinase [Verrucomicrobiales bacterium]